MRLIDADALLIQIRQIDFLKIPNSTKLSACEIMKVLNEQPTAYDVDKVVEELKKAGFSDESAPNRVVAIVRKGGKE